MSREENYARRGACREQSLDPCGSKGPMMTLLIWSLSAFLEIIHWGGLALSRFLVSYILVYTTGFLNFANTLTPLRWDVALLQSTRSRSGISRVSIHTKEGVHV